MSLVFTWERRFKGIHTTDTPWVIGSDGQSRIARPEATGNRQGNIRFETRLTWLAY